MSNENDSSDLPVATENRTWQDVINEQNAISAGRRDSLKAETSRKDAIKDKPAKKAKSVKKVYPLTEYESEWAEMQDQNAADLRRIQSDMQDRTRHFFGTALSEARCLAEYRVARAYEQWVPFCESEIEKILLLALISRTHSERTLRMPDPEEWQDDPYGFMSTKMDDWLDWHIYEYGTELTGVLMQVPISDYRADFVLYGISATCANRAEWLKLPLVIECDGHDFHERTKEQAKRDRKRDRALMAAGYHVMRFTGAEIWRDPHACVEEALSFIQKKQDDHFRPGRGRRS